MKKRIIIHGAGNAGRVLAMEIEHIFDIIAFIDRNKATIKSYSGTHFAGTPIYRHLDQAKDLEFDFILVTSGDFEGIQREYRNIYGVPENKLVNMRNGYQEGKRQLFYSLANEIFRMETPGAVVELGVNYGDTAKYINFFFYDRTLYLFDTFEGFPKQGDLDFEKSAGVSPDRMAHFDDDRWMHLYDDGITERNLLRKMHYPEKCVIKKGVFPESLRGLEGNFAFVHIDCDFSKPIQAALEYFYPRLSPGGYICVHDYYHPIFSRVRVVVREYAERNGVALVPVPSYGGAVITKIL
ncbi:MAG: TylF/MycF family methyltransferase [Planctomycetota bacterium]|jgi:O-methyltransferase|nr:TylF/MycF family methyltransferase [Planctomycetota bacterium]